MKTLVLITSQFPFGTGESFIESEFPLLAENFDKILIFSQNISSEKNRKTSENTVVYRYNPATSLSEFLYFPIFMISSFGTILNLFREEIRFRKNKEVRLSVRNLTFLFKKIIKALQLKSFISKTLFKEGINDSIVFYSYWLKTGAHAIALLDYKNSIKIARAHGSDIYEEKTESAYLPLLSFSASNLDAIFFISKDGKDYFVKKTGKDNPYFMVSYLGVKKPVQDLAAYNGNDRYLIVSCSNMVPLKRIDLIIRALKMVNPEREIEWMHFGDGILKKELEQLAENLLQSTKISFRFMGHYPNDELLKYYSLNKVDLFINTSSTEGIPVSIMEAQAFGIPVIATNTGGLKEIVTEGTGSLLPVNFMPEDLARLIGYYLNLTESESSILRTNAFNNWNLNYNAMSNYRNFIINVNSIFTTAK